MAYTPVLSKRQWPFTPQSIPGLKIWLDAADTSSYTPSTDIRAWRNKVVYGTPPAYTSYVGSVSSQSVDGINKTVNNLNILTFNSDVGFSLQFRLPSITYSQTIRSIFYLINVGAYDDAISTHADGSNNAFQFKIEQGTLDFTNIITLAQTQRMLSLNPVSLSNKTSIIFITTSTGFFVDGSPIPTTFGSPITMNIGASGPQDIGNFHSSGFIAPPFNIGDFLIFDGAITDAERQQVEGYLANKWGITSQLPATHPYKPLSVPAPPISRPFQPVDIAGCQLWLDAGDASTIVGTPSNVSSWNDKSGNGNNATQSTTANQPTYSNNGIVMNGSSNYLSSPVRIPTNTHCLIAVHNPTTLTENTSLLRFQSGTYIVFPYRDGATGRGYINEFDGTATAHNSGTLSENSVAGFKNLIIANIASGSQLIYKNGALQNSATASLTSGTSDPLTIGAISGPSQFYNGTIYEIIIYNTSLTNNQRLQIEAYLAQKWNISSSLTSAHPGYYLPSYSTAFTPKTLGPALWLDAADSSTITGANPVTAWADKSGNGNNATAYGSPQLIANVLKGQSAIYLPNPTNVSPYSFFQGSVSITGTTQSVFAVIQNTSAVLPNASNGRIVSLTTPNNYDFGSASFSALYSFTTPGFRTQRNLGGYTSSGALSPDAYVAEVIYDGTNVRLYNGGNLAATEVSTGTFGVTAYGIGNYPANANPGIAETFNGYIGEVLIYNTALTTTQRQQVEGYLAWKWGTASTLPSTHPYAKFSP